MNHNERQDGAQDGEKLCRRCGEVKPLGEFYNHRYTGDQKQTYCKPCMKTYNEAYAKTDKGKEAIRAAVARWRTKKYAPRFSKNEKPITLEAIWERQKGVCAYCLEPLDQPNMELDHVIPVAMNGPETMANLVLSCRPCNRAKGTNVWVPKTGMPTSGATPESTPPPAPKTCAQRTRMLFQCPKCGEMKPKKDYYPDTTETRCRDCVWMATHGILPPR